MKAETKTKIRVEPSTIERLERLKLTQGESLENVIVRLIIKYEGLI